MRGVGLGEFQSDPVGCYVQGHTFSHFCLTPTLWGVLLWGRPTKEHAIELGRSLVIELAPPAEPHSSIVDASRLESGDPDSFHMLERYMARYSSELARWVRRLALVRPTGLSGAIVTGAFDVVPSPYPVAVFDDCVSALQWLGEDGDIGRTPRDLAGEISNLSTIVTNTPAIVATLQGVLGSHLRGISLAEAARELGVSERTLQRRLGEVGTTFQDEMASARVRAAQRLLVESDTPVTTIAFDVGCASPQSLSALFRRLTGESPSEWRQRHRKTRAEDEGR